MMAHNEDVPSPSPARGRPAVAPPALSAAKLKAYRAMRAAGLGKRELAARLGWQPSHIHTAPSDQTSAVEIPSPVKRHLGLDDDRSWIVVDEGNEFLWPGYDLRKIPRTDRYHYGFLPPRFFNRVLYAFAACYEAGKRRLTPRE
jgi:hypothetical protein